MSGLTEYNCQNLFLRKTRAVMVCGTVCPLRHCKWNYTNCLGSFAISIVLAVYIHSSHKQHIFKEKYKIVILFFSALYLCFSIFPKFSILFSYIKLLMRDTFYVILCTFSYIFSMTHKKFGKVMQTNTIFLAENIFLLNWEASHS